MPSNKWSTGWFPKTKTKERNGKGARVVTRNKGPIFRKSLLRKPLHCVCFVVADLLYMRISPLGMLLVGLWHDYHYCFRGEKERKSLWKRRCSFGERQNMFVCLWVGVGKYFWTRRGNPCERGEEIGKWATVFFLQSFALKSLNLQVDRENGDDQWDLGKRFLLEGKR